MTTTDTIAASLWLQLVAEPQLIPPFGALEELMDATACERAEAIRVLHEAAADWVHLRGFDDCQAWYETPREVECRIRSGILCLEESCGRLDPIADIRGALLDPDSGKWLPWCDAVDAAVAVLRELTSIP